MTVLGVGETADDEDVAPVAAAGVVEADVLRWGGGSGTVEGAGSSAAVAEASGRGSRWRPLEPTVAVEAPARDEVAPSSWSPRRSKSKEREARS